MTVQNLRNKYSDHPCFMSIIKHCDKNNISFEIMKEAHIDKSYKIKKIYYMKVDDVLVTSYVDSNSWNSVAHMLAKAYNYLGLEIPHALRTLTEFFDKSKENK